MCGLRETRPRSRAQRTPWAPVRRGNAVGGGSNGRLQEAQKASYMALLMKAGDEEFISEYRVLPGLHWNQKVCVQWPHPKSQICCGLHGRALIGAFASGAASPKGLAGGLCSPREAFTPVFSLCSPLPPLQEEQKAHYLVNSSLHVLEDTHVQ